YAIDVQAQRHVALGAIGQRPAPPQGIAGGTRGRRRHVRDRQAAQQLAGTARHGPAGDRARPGPAGDPLRGRRALADGAERDVPLRLYVDSVRQKLERTAVLGGASFSRRDVRIDPLVSLTLRSDGSIDDITIVRSSGRADMDDAVRRFVHLNARYSAFPPNVAARFDIIEIRRVWRFADGLKLLEELR
ncbi:MAG: hypothetical protein EOP92_35985, partial [Lysobacteraceae bacterium]